MNLEILQPYMREQRIDAWLVYDFRGSNPIFASLLAGQRWTTRRAALLIPAAGAPVLLGHSIDHNQFAGLSIPLETYLTWGDFRDWLARRLAGCARVAMEYAPGGALPVVSIVDAGTVELVRSLGVEVVSSANLIQLSAAVWSEAGVQQHRLACRQVAEIKDAAFALIGEKLAAGQKLLETDVQSFIVSRFAQAGLEANEPPIVAVNAHAGDPHYEPSEKTPTEIRRGDWVLIDLWARRPGRENIFSDITWVGLAGGTPSNRQREVFEVVRRARDAVVQRAQAAWRGREALAGWQLDDVARSIIVEAGYGAYVRHRTGHSLSPGEMVHGLGFNLDNLETHDTRQMLPRLGFTVEPGIYLPEFGVRLEINVYVDPQQGPVVTSPIQNEIVLIG